VSLSRWLTVSALAAALTTGASSSAHAQDYPRLGLYGSMFGDGYPLWDSTGVANPAVLDQIARYHEVVLDASPITPYRPDVALALRARRPDIRLLAYVSGQNIWYANQPDSLVHFPTRYWRTVRDLDGFLYNTSGGLYGSQTNQACDVNLAKSVNGHYVVAEAIADLFYDAIVKTGIWDGVFVDCYCDNMLWMEAAGEYVNVTRAGYPDRASFATAWKAATDTLAARLRRLSGPTEILVGNCAAGTKYAWFNGWMRENFPYQGGGTWYTNLYNDPGGYLVDEQRFLTPRSNYIFSAAGGLNTPYTADNARKVRLGLGTASLGGGFGVFGDVARVSRNQQYMAWWYDEYAVDLSTGRSSTQIQNTGWLGQPLSGMYQMVWVGPTPDASTNPTFETSVTTGWRFFTTVGSSISRDATTAGEGSASAHVTIPTADPGVEWATAFSTAASLPVTMGTQYSATFWAKAAFPRTIVVSAGFAGGGGSYALTIVQLTTQWQRYQVVLIPDASGNAELDFNVAGQTGDVWFDDVHFQQGVYSVYRRDFQNGSVLVNPGSTAQSVVLESSFRRILGSVDPTTNNGLNSTSQTVPAMDALFLIGADRTPPAAVQDLHAVPPPPAPAARLRRPR